MNSKCVLEGSAKVCTIKYGEPIKVRVKISIPELPSWYKEGDKK